MHKASILLAAFALAAGCGSEPSTTESTPDLKVQHSTPAEHQGLAAARAATARFHRFDVAHKAGYDFLFMDMCMVDQSGHNLGGMGYHYVNTDLLDDKVDVNSPEAVLYEPGKNGQLRLVGLEYVIPAAAWTSPEPPELLGQQLKLNAFGLWALHVWIWKRNPSDIYADWNPDVNCENAVAVRAGGRH